MALRQSRMIELGTRAPDFALPDVVSGRIVGLADFSASPALLVAFICNHCPYVKHVRAGFAAFAREYGSKGLAIVAISANDAAAYPDDAPEAMAREAKNAGFTFPYLYDETQVTARAYEAICTPDFFLFDRERRLVYRGRFDASRPGSNVPVSGADLRAAADALLAGRPVPTDQQPSMGCSIKWTPGHAPAYA
ncbi:thioredoxin family protein [Betaproteobacteria bacterium PRO7]|nr:thioredoxin family protein [Betaproteobacteria bacterium PRO7]